MPIRIAIFLLLSALLACSQEAPPPHLSSEISDELLAAMVPRDDGVLEGPHPSERYGGHPVLNADWLIRIGLSDLSEAKLLLNCFAEYLPPEARIRARIPGAEQIWPGFEGAVLDRKAEFFLRFPPGLPEQCVLELQLVEGGANDLRIQKATLERPVHVP